MPRLFFLTSFSCSWLEELYTCHRDVAILARCGRIPKKTWLSDFGNWKNLFFCMKDILVDVKVEYTEVLFYATMFQTCVCIDMFNISVGIIEV